MTAEDLDYLRSLPRENVAIVANTPERLLEVIRQGAKIIKSEGASVVSIFGISVEYNPILPEGMGLIVSRHTGGFSKVIKVLDFREEK